VLLVTLVLAPLQLLALRFDWKLRRRLPRLWHSTTCRLIGIRIRAHGTLERHRPLMIAANHASWKDILVLGALADVVFIAKTEVADWPIFGTLAKLQKSIFVVREQKRRTGDQVSEIAERMADARSSCYSRKARPPTATAFSKSNLLVRRCGCACRWHLRRRLRPAGGDRLYQVLACRWALSSANRRLAGRCRYGAASDGRAEGGAIDVDQFRRSVEYRRGKSQAGRGTGGEADSQHVARPSAWPAVALSLRHHFSV
jgi:1-acyl-sn-glycerol-3-phosphate acyltransferase